VTQWCDFCATTNLSVYYGKQKSAHVTPRIWNTLPDIVVIATCSYIDWNCFCLHNRFCC